MAACFNSDGAAREQSQRLDHIASQVPAIGDLDGLRTGSARGLGISTRPVTADAPCSGKISRSCSHGCCLPISSGCGAHCFICGAISHRSCPPDIGTRAPEIRVFKVRGSEIQKWNILTSGTRENPHCAVRMRLSCLHRSWNRKERRIPHSTPHCGDEQVRKNISSGAHRASSIGH